MDDKIESLISQMTLEEKISLLAGADQWRTVPIPRLGIPYIKTTDGPFGARGDDEPSGPTSACLPAGVALSASWDPELAYEIGQALAEEVKSKGAHILLAPTVNIHRTPLGGRNFECYSEDPYLTARTAIGYIQGLQSRGVGACIKHFACNDTEFERQSISSEVAERPLREIYLRPFQLALRDAKPWAVMSSYNRVNGTYACENDYLLIEILKGEWGFDGLVMSDWYGTYGPRVPQGGLDLEMPGPARWMGSPALDAVNDGVVRIEAIDDKVRRLLRTMERVGAFEHPTEPPEKATPSAEQSRLARRVAADGIVLLKNEENLLPLDNDKVKRIAVIGQNARWPVMSGGGSARVTPHYVISPHRAIQDRVSAARVEYALGCQIGTRLPLLDTSWLKDDLTVEFFTNRELRGSPVRAEKMHKVDLVWFGDVLRDLDVNDFSVRLTGALTVPHTGSYDFNLSCIGQARLVLNTQTVVDLWSERGIEATGSIELEAGRDYPLLVEFAVEPNVRWRNLRIGCIPTPSADSVQEAVNAAARADVAIVFAGMTEQLESEGFDRPNLELPGEQAQLIERVAAANPNTIVVLNSGGPFDMPWLPKVRAVLQAWYLGQETGNAIADVLFGDVNPSARLPTTFPKRLSDTPAFLNYPGENGKVYYGEGLFVGYRYYDKKGIEPLFPFGYGLSYTTFEYDNLQIVLGETVKVSVDVKNTGVRRGKEVVQLYVRDVRSRLVRPEKELKAFSKVALEPGERRTVEMTLDFDSFSYYDPAHKEWIAESGEFEVVVGSSSRDIRVSATFEWQAPAPSHAERRLNVMLPVKDLLADPHGRKILEKYLGQYLGYPGVEALFDMPLSIIAGFAPDMLTGEMLENIDADLAKG